MCSVRLFQGRILRFMKQYLRPLALLAVITVAFGAIYATSQFVLRSTANDPQIQMAQDTAELLNNGATPASLVSGKVDVSKSLSPFIIIYDKSGREVASPAYNGQKPLPAVPFGVLKSADSGYNAVTWQPDPNIRLAAVAVQAHDYYVLSARSLRVTENRESTVFQIAVLGWALTLAVLGIYYYLRKSMSKRPT